jgi:hypothetical protein
MLGPARPLGPRTQTRIQPRENWMVDFLAPLATMIPRAVIPRVGIFPHCPGGLNTMPAF